MKSVVVTLLGVCGAVALAAAPVRLDLPAQDSARALMALARRTDLEVVFLYDDLRRAQSPALSGEFEPEEALRLLLEGTGFAARPAPGGKYHVVPAPSAVARRKADNGNQRASSSEFGDGEPVKLEKFVVTPSRFGISEDLAPRTATFTHDEVARLPQLGEDVFRAVTRVPGLAGSDFSSKFWVRGASHDKVLTRLDGNTLLEPFHLKDLGGALSVVDLETVSRLELFTGGFTSEFGDRLAGVMRMETDRPVTPTPRTTLGLSLMGARATSRGTFANGRGAWLLSGRLGYPDVSLEIANADELTPRYHDVFAKLEYDLSPDHTLSIDLLHARDRLRYFNPTDDVILNSRYRDGYAWLRWRAQFGNAVSAETVLGLARLGWNRVSRAQSDRRRDIDDRRTLETATLRQDWSVALDERTLLRAGYEAMRGEADYRYDSVVDVRRVANGALVTDRVTRQVARAADGQSLGAYLAARVRFSDRLVAEPGLRFDHQDYAGGAGMSPRLNVAADFGRTTVRAAWGVYRQAQGLHELPVRDGGTEFSPAERARQFVVGVERILRPGLIVRGEFYSRTVGSPRAHWENLANPLRLVGELDFDRVRLAPGEARAHGVEMSLRGHGPRWRWSAGYIWSEAEEKIDGGWLPVIRDQRHFLMLDGTWSPNGRWDISAAWQYHTGWPATEFSYELAPFGGNSVLFERRIGEPFAARLPGYHRLDLRVTRIWRGPRYTVRAFLDVFNAYGAKNYYRYDTLLQGSGLNPRQIRTPQKSLPILPSAGVQWDF